MAAVRQVSSIGLMLVFIATYAGVASAQPRGKQEAAREVEKAAKNYDKALQKSDRAAAKDVRRAFKPGSKEFPEGITQHPGVFRFDRIRAQDLGVSLLNQGPGIVIEQINPGSALADYGFRERDRILSVGEHRVTKERDFIDYLFADNVRFGRVGVGVLHDNDQFEEIQVAPEVLLEGIDPGHNNAFDRLGVVLGDSPDNELRVKEVIPQTPASVAGIRRGDVIVGFAGKPVKSAEKLAELVGDAEPDVHVIVVARDQSERRLDVKLRK